MDDIGQTEKQPERFYHGFVLGLMVELRGKYRITSNQESGYGRYDVILEPFDKHYDSIILEFKVYDPKKEKTLEDTIKYALKQINGFAFEGKKVLIGC